MKTKQELSDILDFVAEYASYLLGSGVHTSRVIRNAQRIGTSQGVDIQLSSFQKSIIITVHDERSGEVVTRVVKIPALPISFERNSDLSALSWDAVDEHLSLTDLRDRYGELIAKPRMDPIFVLPRFLNLGAAGAGAATAISNTAAALFFILFAAAKRRSTIVSLSPARLKRAHKHIKDILAVGFPSAVQYALTVVSIAAISKFVSGYATEAVAALGIVIGVDDAVGFAADAQRVALDVEHRFCVGRIGHGCLLYTSDAADA